MSSNPTRSIFCLYRGQQPFAAKLPALNACRPNIHHLQVIVVLDTRNAEGREERQSRTDAFNANAVTLGLVGGPADLEALMLEAAQWDGPKVLQNSFITFSRQIAHGNIS